MAPHSSPKSVRQSTDLLKAFNKLCAQIGGRKQERSKKNRSRASQGTNATSSGSLVDSDTLNTLTKILYDHRNSGKTMEKAFPVRIVKSLESMKDDICNRLDPEVFNIILRILLQADQSHESERAIYLLGASIYKNNQKLAGQKKRGGFDKKRSAYANVCLYRLLADFIDTLRPAGMRRCLGILCVQLLFGATEARSEPGQSVEQVRQKLGLLIVEERSEIIRVLCGQIIRAMLNGSATLDQFWPSATNALVSQSFPTASQGERGWDQKFQEYVDKVWENLTESPDVTGRIWFLQDVNLRPESNFETLGHTVNLVVEEMKVNIIILASADNFDQYLEIPTDCIQKMVITTKPESQINMAGDFYFILKKTSGSSCVVNSKETDVMEVHMVAILAHIRGIVDDLEQSACDLEIIGAEYLPASPKDQDRSPPMLSQVSESNAIITWDGGDAMVVSKSHSGTQPETPEQPTSREEISMSSPGLDVLLEPHLQKPDQHSSCTESADETNASDEEALLRTQKITQPKQSSLHSKSTIPKNNPAFKQVRPVAKKPLQLGQGHGQPKLQPSSQPADIAISQLVASKASGLQHLSVDQRKVNNKIEQSSKTVKSQAMSATADEADYSIEIEKQDIFDLAPSPATKSGSKSKAKAKLNGGDSAGKKTLAKPKVVPAVRARTSTRSQTSRETPQHATLTVLKKYSLKGKKLVAETDVSTAHLKWTKRPAATAESEDSQDDEYRPTASASKSKRARKTRATASTLKSRSALTTRSAQAKSSMKKTDSLPSPMVCEAEDESLVEPLGADNGSVNLQYDAEYLQKDEEASDPAAHPDETQFSASLSAPPEASDNAPLQHLALGTKHARKRMASTLNNMLAYLSDEHSEAGVNPEIRRSLKASFAESDGTPGRSVPRHQILGQPSPLISVPDQSHATIIPLHPPSLSGKPVISANTHIHGPTTDLAEKARASSPARLSTPIRIGRQSSAEAASTSKVESESATGSKKRKVATEQAGTSKRQRPTATKAASNQTPLRRSPRIQAIADRKSRRQMQEKQAYSSHKQMAPKSPEVSSGAEEASKLLNDSVQNKVLVDDLIIRKPQLISFNIHGACNQGPSRLSKASVERVQARMTTLQKHTTWPQDVKRKRQVNQSVESGELPDGYPPRKRQSVSPDQMHLKASREMQEEPVADGVHYHGPACKENDVDCEERLANNKMVDDKVRGVPGHWRPTRASSKNSSQTSWVAPNGSPMSSRSSADVAHFGTLSRKLLIKLSAARGASEVIAAAEDLKLSRVSGSPSNLEPNITLANLVKARPSLPNENQTLYIAHKKTGRGLYEGIQSREVVLHEDKLPDPFLEAAGRGSSGFADRLRSGSRRAVDKANLQMSFRTNVAICQDRIGSIPLSLEATVLEQRPDNSKSPLLSKANRESGTRYKLPKHISWMPLDETDMTIVELENRTPNTGGTGPGLTSNGFSPSGSNEESHHRTPLEGKADLWNSSIIPYYRTFSEAVHRIADEMVIRLSAEEETMGLMVSQYQSNGWKILNELAEKRQSEKSNKQKYLDQKRKEVTAVYAEAKQVANKTAAELKENSITAFEADWRKEQRKIQQGIADGRAGV